MGIYNFCLIQKDGYSATNIVNYQGHHLHMNRDVLQRVSLIIVIILTMYQSLMILMAETIIYHLIKVMTDFSLTKMYFC
jgi:hypothetical protein